MKDLYIRTIAGKLSVREWQVENCVKLFEDGATIPFISRYRKEKTGGLDDVAVAEIRHWADVYSEMDKRKESMLSTIREAGKLTSELEKAILDCVDSRELEDLYLPFRPKRRTRATVAKEAGLDGVVCSPLEAGMVKEACGAGFMTVTPGVRFADGDKGDQVRITTPARAAEIGTDYIVVGRPITEAADPVGAYRRCMKEFLMR